MKHKHCWHNKGIGNEICCFCGEERITEEMKLLNKVMSTYYEEHGKFVPRG